MGEYPENNFLHKYVQDMLFLAIPSSAGQTEAEGFSPNLFEHVFKGKASFYLLVTRAT